MSPTDLKPENSNTKTQNYQGPSEEQRERYRMFMIGGGCKESFTAFEDCEGNTIVDCSETMWKLDQCMKVHLDYYQPYYSIWKTVDEIEERNRDPVFPAKEPKEKAKQVSEFMRGPCRESIRSFRRRDAEYTRNNNTLTFHRKLEAFDTVYKCMEAHSDYNQYQAFLASMKRRYEYYDKEFDAAARKL